MHTAAPSGERQVVRKLHERFDERSDFQDLRADLPAFDEPVRGVADQRPHEDGRR